MKLDYLTGSGPISFQSTTQTLSSEVLSRLYEGKFLPQSSH